MTTMSGRTRQSMVWTSVVYCALLIYSCSAWTTNTLQQQLWRGSVPASLTRNNIILASTKDPITDGQVQSTVVDDSQLYKKNKQENNQYALYKLQGRLLKKMRQTCLDYQILEEGDHIMVCVSGGKDSATLLHLLVLMRQKLRIKFRLTAVHVNQNQPGYNGTTLVEWLQKEYDDKYDFFDYRIVDEDTYSIVVDKTQPGKSFCTVCSRLRRGILYSTALKLGCNKIALGHHADDCLETLMLNMIHGGQMKAMPVRYTSQRGSLAVVRPLMHCFEDEIADYAARSEFPIMPCNLCSNQANLQRPQVKLLLSSLEGLTPTAKQNMLRSCHTIKPSHLLDQNLRAACGMDPITGEEEGVDDEDQPI
jgi:tRNA 2-thiocytidine biosynthesis protein TtcA